MATAPITRSALPLNHVFAPLAPALPHDQNVQVTHAAPPRKPGRLARAATYIVKQARLLAAGPGPRADAHHRHHLKKASQAMDRLLRTLIENPRNAPLLVKSLHAMAAAARSLGKGVDIDLSLLFTVRATVQLERLPDEQLREVSENLAHWATLDQAPEQANALSQLERLVNKEEARRKLFVGCLDIRDHRAAGPQAAGVRFERVMQSMDLLISQLEDDGTAPRTRQLSLAKELLTQNVDNGCLSASDLRLLLDSLPSEQLNEWLNARHAPEFHKTQAMDQSLEDAIGRRQDLLEGEAIAALSGVSRALNTPADVAQLASTVTTLATRWSALKAHCDASGLAMPTGMTQTRAGLQQLLNSALEQQAQELAKLPREQLHPFGSALATLGLNGSYTPTLANAVDKLGIKTFPLGRLEFPGPRLQGLMAADLAQLAGSEATAYTPLGQSLSTGVVEAMWLDLPRATYAIEHEDGGVEILVSPANGFSVRSPELHRVTAGLQQGLRLDEAGLLAMSRVTNQQLWGGLTEIMQTPDSPIRLPDGTPGSIAGQPSDSFTVRRGPGGQLIVRCDHELKDITAFIDPLDTTLTPVLLDPAQSHAWFSQEFEIGTDGQIRVTQPLVCSSVLVPITD